MDKEYIGRKALLDEIRRIGGHVLSEWDTLGVRALVVRQPTADVVEVRHGEWLDNGAGFTCSECKWRCRGVSYYCPNCGAKMDGKGEV